MQKERSRGKHHELNNSLSTAVSFMPSEPNGSLVKAHHQLEA